VRSLGVAVAYPDPGVADELVHAVEAEADLYLALDPARAAVVLAGEEALSTLGEHPADAAVVGVAADRDAIAVVARAALRCGAHEIVLWPQDRAMLRSIVRDAATRARIGAGRAEGRIVAVAGARGGVGTTTVAAMLARAFAESAVVDLDPIGAGLSGFLSDGAEPTLAAVVAAVDDLDPAALSAAMAGHAAGRAICAEPREAAPTKQQAARMLALLRATVPVAVIDAGRAADDAAMAAISLADQTICVCTPDVASIRGARALIAAAGRGFPVVLNRSARMRLSAKDVARVVGAPPVAVIPDDPAIRRAGEAGRLPSRGAARRAIERLAGLILAEASDGS